MNKSDFGQQKQPSSLYKILAEHKQIESIYYKNLIQFMDRVVTLIIKES